MPPAPRAGSGPELVDLWLPLREGISVRHIGAVLHPRPCTLHPSHRHRVFQRCSSARWFGRAFGRMLWRAVRYVNAPASLQLRVLRLGLLQDGNVGVGVLPEGKEVLIRGAGFGGVALESISAGETEMGKRAKRKINYDATMVEKLLKLGGSSSTVMRQQLRLPP